jgi:hypothetical protein
MVVIHPVICGVDLIQTNGYTTSNPGRWSIDGQWRSALAHPTMARQGKPNSVTAGRAAHRSTVARALWCTKRNGEIGKRKRGSWGCSPRVANGSAHGSCVSRRWGGSSSPGWWRRLNVGVLWFQEDDGKLHNDILVLLPASIVASGGESVVHGGG